MCGRGRAKAMFWQWRQGRAGQGRRSVSEAGPRAVLWESRAHSVGWWGLPVCTKILRAKPEHSGFTWNGERVQFTLFSSRDLQ